MTRFRPAALAAALAVFLWGCVTQPVEEPASVSQCLGQTMESIAASLEVRTGIKGDKISGDALVVFMAAFNKSPPPTNIDSDEITLFTSPITGQTLVIIGQGGCAVSTASTSRGVAEMWKRGIVPINDI